ncbi:hypothetical protein BT63DRAFT_476317 [Microthyrium microscopicum]|uniref:lytic cellulose monooxygenase (C4-dehydrogenating) n=1 Tax=Microthyrium microscopicum TaxID=703497 RepID=A0A6A6UQ02_9PEZI|nr:hypothetical protein BT63DRAFT_476317 [Microthyrium microscopicum]
MLQNLYTMAVVGATLVAGHGYVKSIDIDGTTYPGYMPMVDKIFEPSGLKRVVWGAPEQNTFGVGPVVDVASPDLACRAGAVPGALTAQARAGSKLVFQWSDWFRSHKGPILTYMARFDSPKKPQDLEFFKIDQSGYDQQTHTWATDLLIKQNNTWSLTIPSDIKPGKYVVRHELIALQFASAGNPLGAGTTTTGAQLYPICVNVEVTGTGTTTPAGVRFPGAYSPKDPGILYDLYYGANTYPLPGPSVYQGKHDPPVGPVPVVKNVGEVTTTSDEVYAQAVSIADKEFKTIQSTVDKALPGGGGCHWDVDANGKEIAGTNKCTNPNEGLPLDMLDAPIVTGNYPGGAAYKGDKTNNLGVGTSQINGIFGKAASIKGRRMAW